MKTFFSDKGLASNITILQEKNNLITDDQKLASLFNIYFVNITDPSQLKKKITLNIFISFSLSLFLSLSLSLF